jgi:hypothetical protein
MKIHKSNTDAASPNGAANRRPAGPATPTSPRSTKGKAASPNGESTREPASPAMATSPQSIKGEAAPSNEQVNGEPLSPTKAVSPQPTNGSVTARPSDVMPRLQVVRQGDRTNIEPDCENVGKGFELLTKATGAEDFFFLKEITGQAAVACGRGGVVDESLLNSTMLMIRAAKPTNQEESLLALQKGVVHNLFLEYSQRLATAKTPHERGSFANIFTKLARTYALQVDVLQRFRAGNQQNVTVHNVSVNEGGQAIVGNVTQTVPEDMEPELQRLVRKAVLARHSKPLR